MAELAAAEVGTDNTNPELGGGDIWYGGFPDELKSSEIVKGSKSPEEMAKKHIELNNRFNELQASLPAYPASPDEYQIEIPEGAKVDEAAMAEVKKLAFENKISTDALNKLVNFQVQREKNAQEKAVRDFNQRLEVERKESESALKKEWGNNFDVNLKLAQRVANKFLSGPTIEYLNKSGFGDNPELVKAFYEIGKKLSEDVFVAGEPLQKEEPKGDYGQVLFDLPKSLGPK